MNILVVDDEKLNLVIAKDYINSIMDKCNVLLCSSPKDVMGILEDKQIDIVLLDIVMPGISGIHVLKSIRDKEEYNNIQVIMLTSLGDKDNFKVCFEIGADDYIIKPINLVEFSARLKAAIKTRRNTLIFEEMFEQIKYQNKELMELNEKLKDTQFNMLQKEKLASIGELAAGVAHEINNPIGFIGSNLETMSNFIGKIMNVISSYRESIDNIKTFSDSLIGLKEEIEKIERIEKKYKLDFIVNDLDDIIKDSRQGIERISKIVQSLRGFARTGMEDEKAYYHINKIIDEVLLIVLNEAKYTIDIKNKQGFIPEILCNRGQIGQVVLNLLVNAIQAIKSQERTDRGCIKLETYTDEKYVCCKIADDGPGIKREIIGKIFDPFFTTKDVGKGTGLGLSISYDIIVKKHKGQFFVSSEPEKGATFIFKIPI